MSDVSFATVYTACMYWISKHILCWVCLGFVGRFELNTFARDYNFQWKCIYNILFLCNQYYSYIHINIIYIIFFC